MNMLRQLLSCFLFLLIINLSYSQEDLVIGQWDSHLPFKTAKRVTQSETKVYFATDEALMIYDKDDSSFEFLSKVNGLSEVGIEQVLYDDINELLVVAYSNSVIDIVQGNDVFRVSDIKDKTSIQGDKQIYDLYIQNGKFLYIATGFGLVQFDLISLEFGFTLDISERVSAIDGDGDDLVMALPEAAYFLDLSTTNIPAFFDEWTRIESGLPTTYQPVDVYMQEGRIYIATQKDVYQAVNGLDFQLIYVDSDEDMDIQFIKDSNAGGYMLGLRHNDPFKGNSKVVKFDASNIALDELTSCTNRLIDAVIDEQNRIFFADQWEGVRFKNDFNGDCTKTDANSPNGASASDIAVSDNGVYFTYGGVTENFGFIFQSRGIYILNDNEWTNLTRQNNEFMSSNDIQMTYSVAADPRSDRVFFGSFWSGLIEYRETTGELKLYDESSPLEFQIGDPRVKITGLAFDDDSNLWISNFSAPKPIVVMTPDGDWFSFEIEQGDDKVEDILVDESGIVWVVIGGTNGSVVVHDPAGTPLDPTDDIQRNINLNNSEIESNLVYCLAEDRSGSVWVGTGQGAVVFECGRTAVESSCEGNRRKVLQDSIVAFLLESEEVLSIAVDGADRKWFGTRNGIFVQSPDGEQQIAQYDSDNSPLFDNTVRAMAYEPEIGIMYIATDKGIQSIRTESTGSIRVHKSNVFAFPNPVRPEYQGPIAIKGLATDAEIRITDISGRLVHESEALGGQAIWDGSNLVGKQVPGGVYLVFSSAVDDFDGVDTHVAKILVVR